MKTQFYIDRQFGHPIYLEVENGIFTGCTHKGKMEDKITEHYKGKTISEFKKLFEKAFEGVYTCVHSADYTTLLQKHHAWSTRIRAKWQKIMISDTSEELKKALKESIEDDRKKQYRIELQLRDKYIELKDIHGFVYYENLYKNLEGNLD